MRWLVDIDRGVAEGLLAPEAGEALKARARAEAMDFGINVLLIGGICTVLLGVLALSPTAEGLTLTGAALTLISGAALGRLAARHRLPASAGAVIGLASLAGGLVSLAIEMAGDTGPAIWIGLAILAGGLALRQFGPAHLRPMGAWAAVFGGAAHLAGTFGLDDAAGLGWLAMLDAAAVLLLLGLALDLRLLTALAVFALAGTLATTAYDHASYLLAVYEPGIAIVMMGGLALLAALLAPRLAERWARHGRIFGLMALIWVNLAFWVGSLWGDRPGESLRAPPRSAFATAQDYREARRAFRETLVEIPEGAFALGWAVLLVAVAVWAGLTGRRSVLNAAAVFGAIHFYTQWFERLETEPLTVIAAGAIAIAAAWGMLRLNAWMEARAAAGGG
ncbi:hypothetical protein LNKW23_38580 [Paralimibaculum aggregatum]|uniref:DUF2157 domain-containing protein n=1 Tax=Paralimibaculum aggregatum TaxID=3036245 RepID=A0ABQ6LNR9_9RHOB|nr:hypothetical protein [Limibaculum sp. NKW23]GMG84642.1 hypothetical protein LNKW23_38580 [Limibaculum sp. NKW23]